MTKKEETLIPEKWNLGKLNCNLESLIVKKHDEWNELKLSPFYKNVINDGIKL